jgi:hypothetical protein
MSKLSEIISTIRNLPRGGQGDFDDNAYTDRQIAFIVNYYRAKLVQQDIDRGSYLTQFYNQTLGKVKLIRATKIECGDMDCEVGNYILRSEFEIPKAIDTKDKNLITYVGTVDGNLPYQRTTFQEATFDKYAKYTGRRTKYYELNNYIYIINPPTNNLKYITIIGVFEDPIKVNEFKKVACDSNDYCFNPFDMEYPMGMKYIDTIYKLITATEFRFNHILQYDTSNNSKDDNQIVPVQ